MESSPTTTHATQVGVGDRASGVAITAPPSSVRGETRDTQLVER